MRERQARRALAATFIQHRWRLHKKSLERKLMRRAKLEYLRRQVAINRIYDLHKLIQVRKVTASSFLVYGQLVQAVAQAQERHPAYIESVLKIQRKWRAVLTRKYTAGRRICAQKRVQTRIFETVLDKKYRKLQAVESRHLYTEAMFQREDKNLEGYFWKQMTNYTKDLETRAAKIGQRVNADFVLADWTLNGAAREWTNSSKSMTVKLERGETTQVTTLRDKLVQKYVAQQLPNEEAIHRQLDDLVEGRTAMQKALRKEMHYKRAQMRRKIKRQRLANLFPREGEAPADQQP